MGTTLREAGPADAGTLLAIERTANLTALGHVFPPAEFPYPDADVLARWTSVLDDPDFTCRIAVLDGVDVGFVAWHSTTIDHLGVLPTAQRAGIGSALMRQALDAISNGHTSARLWVLRDNHSAIRFYEATGWTPTGATQPAEFPPHPTEAEYTRDLLRIGERA